MVWIVVCACLLGAAVRIEAIQIMRPLTVDVAYAVWREVASRFETLEKFGGLGGVVIANDNNLAFAEDGAALGCEGGERYTGVVVYMGNEWRLRRGGTLSEALNGRSIL